MAIAKIDNIGDGGSGLNPDDFPDTVQLSSGASAQSDKVIYPTGSLSGTNILTLGIYTKVTITSSSAGTKWNSNLSEYRKDKTLIATTNLGQSNSIVRTLNADTWYITVNAPSCQSTKGASFSFGITLTKT